MVLDTSLLNTQHYMVRINGKVEQSRERIWTPSPLHLDRVDIDERTLGAPLATVANFIYDAVRLIDLNVKFFLSFLSLHFRASYNVEHLQFNGCLCYFSQQQEKYEDKDKVFYPCLSKEQLINETEVLFF